MTSTTGHGLCQLTSTYLRCFLPLQALTAKNNPVLMGVSVLSCSRVARSATHTCPGNFFGLPDDHTTPKKGDVNVLVTRAKVQKMKSSGLVALAVNGN